MKPELLREIHRIRRTSSATNLRAQRIEKAIEKRVSTPAPPKTNNDGGSEPENGGGE